LSTQNKAGCLAKFANDSRALVTQALLFIRFASGALMSYFPQTRAMGIMYHVGNWHLEYLFFFPACLVAGLSVLVFKLVALVLELPEYAP